MNDYDLYYVDGRNAVVDHRTGQVMGAPGRPPMGGTGVRTMVASPMQPVGQSAMYGQPGYFGPQGPGYWGPSGWVPQPGFGQWGPQGPFGSSLLARISTGQLVDLIAQVFAALNPLPTAPVATNDASTDVGNLILYQGSLATYAKKDEQVRTLGHLVGKLIG